MTLTDTIRYLHGFCFGVPIMLTAWTYMVFVFPPLSVLLLFQPTRLYFHVIRSLIFDFWKHFAALGLEWFALTKIRVTVDDKTELSNESTLFISNHPTHLDWHPLLCLTSRCGQNGRLRMVIKDELRRVPVGGWAWQLGMYIFLSRQDRDKDVAWLSRCLQHWKDSGIPGSWLIFPEGTTISPDCIAKNKVFASERGLAVYEHVLHPRTAGFVSMLQQGRSHLDAVYDITVVHQYFSEGERPNELSYVKGRFPPAVHMHVKRYAVQDLPMDDDGLADWCKDRWAEKEAMLEAANASMALRHLPFRLPGKGLPATSEIGVRVKYCLALLFNGVVCWYLLGLLGSWPWLLYATVMSVAWHLVATKVGVDRILVGLDW